MGVSGGVSIATALAVEYGIARAAHANTESQIIAMLLGAMVAMMGSMALTSGSAWVKARTAALFPVAFGVGMSAGVAVGSHTDLMLGVFVLVMFASVIVRRLGPSYFFYGFQLWMGYFFASFTHATVSTLPSLLLTVVTSSVWVALLSMTVLRANPRRAVARTRTAFEARARDVARASAALLEAAVTDPSQVARWRRRLTGRQARLNEAALMIEAWSAEPNALPASRSATALRRHLLDAQLAIDGLAAAAAELAGSRDTARLIEAAGIAGLLAGREYDAADRAARELLDRTEDPGRTEHPDRTEHTAGGPGTGLAARRVAGAAAEFVAVVRDVRQPLSTAEAEEFAPAVTLAMGNLPGSAAFASQVAARGHRWNPLARLDFISRQAFQAAVAGGLAILIGREISTTRYYWAVLAAFIAFSGTATRSETSIKALNRVVGTLVGLFAGLALARTTAGHTAWIVTVVVLSMAFGLYLMRISYRYMIFFITIMIAQLYSVLHELSDGLLMLRLEETAVGAAIGIVVALVLAPLSTRDVVATVRRNVLTAFGDLLRAAADQLDVPPDRPGDDEAGRPEDRPDLDGLIRGVDLRMYQLTLAAAPLTRPFVWGNSPSRTRHLLNLYSATAYYARSLAAAVRHPVPSAAAASASRELAEAAAALAGTETVGAPPAATSPAAVSPADASAPGMETAGTGTAGTEAAGAETPEQARRSALAHLDAADTALFAQLQPSRVDAGWPAIRALVHLRQLLRELATFGQPAGPGAERSSTVSVSTVSAPTVSTPAVSAPTGSGPSESGPTSPGPANGSAVNGSTGSAPRSATVSGRTASGATAPGSMASDAVGSGAVGTGPVGSGGGGAGASVARPAVDGAWSPSGPVSHRAGASQGTSSSRAEADDETGGPVIHPRHAVSVEGDAQVRHHRRRRRGLSRHAR